ncbi:Transmembrane protein, partial [Ophiophagus hannah]
MKVTLNRVSVFAVLTAVLSFTFLVAALATDFWYQIDASGLEELTNHTSSLKSHRGLWRTCQSLATLLQVSIFIAYSSALFKEVASFQGRKNLMENLNIQFGWSLAFAWVSIGTELLTGLAFILMAKMVGPEMTVGQFHLRVSELVLFTALSIPGLFLFSHHCFDLNLHGAFVVLLPLSLIIIVFGGMAALATLLGVSIYIAYSAALFKHVASFQGRKNFMENLNIQFGWSLAFAWVSIAAELLTGLAFILMAKMVGQKR